MMAEKEVFFAGGCFWGLEKFLSLIQGVMSTEVGYLNGGMEDVGYKEVCAGSGHAEVVRVVFDDDALSLSGLVEQFFSVIDPFSLNRQGNDIEKDDLVYSVNEWDNYAVEEAIQIVDKIGGSVTVASVGSEEEEEVLRRQMAMGANKGVLLSDAMMLLAQHKRFGKVDPRQVEEKHNLEQASSRTSLNDACLGAIRDNTIRQTLDKFSPPHPAYLWRSGG